MGLSGLFIAPPGFKTVFFAPCADLRKAVEDALRKPGESFIAHARRKAKVLVLLVLSREHINERRRT